MVREYVYVSHNGALYRFQRERALRWLTSRADGKALNPINCGGKAVEGCAAIFLPKEATREHFVDALGELLDRKATAPEIPAEVPS